MLIKLRFLSDMKIRYYFIKIDGKWKIGLKEEYESD